MNKYREGDTINGDYTEPENKECETSQEILLQNTLDATTSFL